MPHTLEGAKLQLTDEQENFCKVVYKKKDDHDRACFFGLWNPEKEYSDEYLIVPFRSVYNNLTKEYPIGTTFANVEGSTDDKKHMPSISGSNTWIGLLGEAYKKEGADYSVTACCAEENTIYKSEDNTKITFSDERKGCKGDIVGGHVLLEVTRSASESRGGTVYLLPICKAHNTDRRCGGPGTGYYMKLQYPMKAVILTRYLEDAEKE